MSRKSSKAMLNIRTLFSQTVDLPTKSASQFDKPLPSAPSSDSSTEEKATAFRARPTDHAKATESIDRSTFYARRNAEDDVSLVPPQVHSIAPQLTLGRLENTPGNAGHKIRRARQNLPMHPVPTEPLPPVPASNSAAVNDSAIHLDELFVLDPNDASQSSIDTVEIESWRLPMLEHSTSKTSSSGSSQAVRSSFVARQPKLKSTTARSWSPIAKLDSRAFWPRSASAREHASSCRRSRNHVWVTLCNHAESPKVGPPREGSNGTLHQSSTSILSSPIV